MYHEPGILEKTAGALGRLRKRGFTMMTGMLRVMLILVSVFTMAFMMRKIRQAKMEIEAGLFWTAMGLMLVGFAVFPSVADLCARLLGIYSTANFLFLFMIFLLIVKLFGITVQLSQLETRQRELVQKLALEKRMEEEMRRECMEASEKAPKQEEPVRALTEANDPAEQVRRHE